MDSNLETFRPKQKIALAIIGHPKHLDALVHDSKPSVRCKVAKHGNDKHRDALVHAKDRLKMLDKR